MSEGMALGDLLLLAVIAVVVVLKLRSMLGKRSGIDPTEFQRKREQELRDRVIQIPPKQGEVRRLEERVQARLDAPEDDKPEDVVESAGLAAIKAADPTFSAKHFLSGAKAAFEMIVNAYGKGDKAALKPLLGPEMFEKFAGDIDERAAAGERQETTLVSVEANEIAEAELKKNLAQVTVKFVSEQITVTRDAKGEVVEGSTSAIEKVTDEWTFERDVRSNNPNWKLIAT